MIFASISGVNIGYLYFSLTRLDNTLRLETKAHLSLYPQQLSQYLVGSKNTINIY